MVDWILSIEDTNSAPIFASALAILAAFWHAVFAALQKGRHDPWLSRGVIDFSYFTMALPLALFVVPWPEPLLWPIMAGVFIIHLIYKILQAMSYTRGNYTVVYPVMRGTAPIFAIIAAYMVFGETFTLMQWTGVAILLGGIFGLAAYNLMFLKIARDTLPMALTFAVATGAFVALYTAYDAWGIRQAVNPFVFIVWFFVIDGIALPPFIFFRWLRTENRPTVGPLILRGMAGGIVAIFSFGSIMLATRLDKVGEAAILRETSTIFAALIGWYFLKEPVGPYRSLMMVMVAAGAVVVEFGN